MGAEYPNQAEISTRGRERHQSKLFGAKSVGVQGVNWQGSDPILVGVRRRRTQKLWHFQIEYICDGIWETRHMSHRAILQKSRN